MILVFMKVQWNLRKSRWNVNAMSLKWKLMLKRNAKEEPELLSRFLMLHWFWGEMRRCCRQCKLVCLNWIGCRTFSDCQRWGDLHILRMPCMMRHWTDRLQLVWMALFLSLRGGYWLQSWPSQTMICWHQPYGSYATWYCTGQRTANLAEPCWPLQVR